MAYLAHWSKDGVEFSQAILKSQLTPSFFPQVIYNSNNDILKTIHLWRNPYIKNCNPKKICYDLNYFFKWDLTKTQVRIKSKIRWLDNWLTMNDDCQHKKKQHYFAKCNKCSSSQIAVFSSSIYIFIYSLMSFVIKSRNLHRI